MFKMVTILASLSALGAAHELKVLHPSDLRKKLTHEVKGHKEEGLIKSSLGNFGHFNYGTTMRGRLHYPTQNSDGCQPFKEEHFNGEHLAEGRKQRHAPIILVDRGNCHFVVKA
jgi:hypothetical protein